MNGSGSDLDHGFSKNVGDRSRIRHLIFIVNFWNTCLCLIILSKKYLNCLKLEEEKKSTSHNGAKKNQNRYILN